MARVRRIALDCDNRHITIKGASKRVIRALDEATSYHVSGYYFSPSFKNGYWDGKEHLLKFRRKEGTYRAPIGLLEDITAVIDEEGALYDIVETGRPEPANIEVYWNEDIKLRPYQLRAVRSILNPALGLMRGTGIIKMPIRSGKTKTVAAVIALLKVSTLFVVPSLTLLHQTRDALSEALGVPIGIIGDSTTDIQDITVASIQTLVGWMGTNPSKSRREAKLRTIKLNDKAKKKLNKVDLAAKLKSAIKKAGNRAKRIQAQYKEVRVRFDMLVMDECHHLTATEWHKSMMDFDARYRVALSATAFPDAKSEQERGVIWLKGCCGPVRIDISTSELIEQGWLAQTDIWLFPVREPALAKRGWSQRLRNEAILENDHRNGIITQVSKMFADQDKRVLIVSNRHNQIAAISELLTEAGVKYQTIVGEDLHPERVSKVAAFVSREYPVLLGTVFGEGVDIPEIDIAINAEGGKDIKATIQRMRNLTLSEDKDKAIFIDFMDMTNAYFAEHARERLAVYRSEPAFNIMIKEAA